MPIYRAVVQQRGQTNKRLPYLIYATNEDELIKAIQHSCDNHLKRLDWKEPDNNL